MLALLFIRLSIFGLNLKTFSNNNGLFFVTIVNTNKKTTEPAVKDHIVLTENHLAILKTLAYSSIFDYPLTYNELYSFVMGKKLSKTEFNELLFNDLIPEYIIFEQNYFTLPNKETIIKKRIDKYAISHAKWVKAYNLNYILSFFPFIRMISITGSLVFNNIKDRHDDIDMFIIVQKNHLWKTRFFVYGFVRILHFFKIDLCPNFMITDRFLELDTKNFYTARELKSMVPLYGLNLFNSFVSSNSWANDFYPNAITKNQMKFKIIGHKSSKIKNVLEKILSLKIFSHLEKFEMNRQIKGLKKLSKKESEIKLTVDCCKSHIDGHGKSITRLFESNLEIFNISDQ